MNESMLRISVAGLTIEIVDTETGEVWTPTIVNSGTLRKKKEYLLCPPGGAALVTAEGERQLAALGAEFTDPPEAGGRDARFLIAEANFDAAMKIVESGDPALIETGVERELAEELTTIEMPEIQTAAILDLEDMSQIRVEPIGLYRQPVPEDGVGSSSNASAAVPTRRSFYLHRVFASSAIIAKLQKAFPIINSRALARSRGRDRGALRRVDRG